ncbi:HIT family protein [Azospirillum thermophilum]|uniref:HIT family protein n=1 Tax=Azospirillum thermophilum TaxID=2202148 RepID=A0A2S2CXM2_9PROT|nr:HIT family protein [Azospirillum thermophilum]AWK89027.1 HIT family protein [Azospirillum thermophilum]
MPGPAPSEPTVFSRLIAGELPCAKVYEDERTFAFMDAGQVNPGHVLVALKRPAETLLDLSEDEAAALFRTVHKVARAVEAAFAPEGITVLQTNRPAGWQTVPHIHVHVVPRYRGDGAELVWPRRSPPMDELKALASRIRVE